VVLLPTLGRGGRAQRRLALVFAQAVFPFFSRLFCPVCREFWAGFRKAGIIGFGFHTAAYSVFALDGGQETPEFLCLSVVCRQKRSRNSC